VRLALAAGAVLVAGAALTGCSTGNDARGSVHVVATDTSCAVDGTTLTAGTWAFEVSNQGRAVTAFSIEGPSGTVGDQLRDLAPGATKTVTVALAVGDYDAVCRPGQSGDGVRQQLIVSSR
jgi:iron uptake system component EfeO